MKCAHKGVLTDTVPSIEQSETFPVQAYIRETGGRDDEEIQAQLLPCRYCLSAINYEGYRDAAKRGRDQIVNDFDLELFLRPMSPSSELCHDIPQKQLEKGNIPLIGQRYLFG